MLCTGTCLKGAVVIGLIAAITPAVWAQSPQEQQTDAPRSAIEAAAAATARGAVLSDIVSPGIRIDAWPTQTGGGGLIWFTNQADFEAFVASQGKVIKGIEDFEEAVLDPGQGVGVDDPLVSGVANPPVFPVGLTGLPNLQVQSNFEHDLFNPNNPRGTDGLAAWAAPGGNFVTDVVIANFFVDSLDLIFKGEKTAVGFNPVNFVSPGAMEVNVFSTANVLLGEMASNSDPAGTNFLGVWSPTPIGRINLFDVSNGSEGADNIHAWEEGGAPENDLCENAIPVPVPGSVVGFTTDATPDDYPFCGTSVGAPGIWYTVIGTGARITATTCSEFSEYDTKINVYCGSCVEPICVGGNDDDCDAFGGLLSTVTWCSQEGTEYLILVNGFGGQTGGFELILFDDGLLCDDPVDCAGGGGGCGDPDAGSCFENNGTPFCDDVLCCLIVCAIDPFCCDMTWDQLCADEATKFCEGIGSASLDQPPNQLNGLFSDVDCDLCAGGVQILAENFNVGEDLTIGTVRIFGGYFPDDLKPVDSFTVNFHSDDGGFPGVIIDSQTRSATHTLTGVELFGVQEYQIDIEIVQLSLTSGTYWVSVYNDTSPHTDSFFWETGNLDPDHGKPGGAFRFDLPGPGDWNFDPKQELATTLLPPDPCPWDLDDGGFVGAGDLLLLLADWGNPYGAADLLALLADWGPCPNNNACANPGVCGEFELCGVGEPFDCLCWTLFDGSGICLQDFFCADVEPCVDGDCPPGFVCVILSCCEGNWCVPIITCDDGAAPGQPKGSGPTGAGRFIEPSQSAPKRPAGTR